MIIRFCSTRDPALQSAVGRLENGGWAESGNDELVDLMEQDSRAVFANSCCYSDKMGRLKLHLRNRLDHQCHIWKSLRENGKRDAGPFLSRFHVKSHQGCSCEWLFSSSQVNK